MKRNYRSLDEIQLEYFQNHPDEIEPFITEILEDYFENGDDRALLASLGVIAQVLQ